MQKLLIALICGVGFSVASASTYEVLVTGPGGHSNGNYGNTNAVHAGSRAVLELEKVLPCAVVTDFKGGATVNAIAADAKFNVDTAPCKGAQETLLSQIEKAVKTGIDKENAFRNAKPGDTVNGFPAQVEYEVKSND